MTGGRLGSAALDAARRFLATRGRPLEFARFRHHFEGAPAGEVLEALAGYRNEDGGFGRSLEPDLRAPESSALCTSVAFQVLRSLGAGPDEPLVLKGIDYFLETLDREGSHWRIIPESAEESPHAPWWDQADLEDSLDRFSLNPTAEILGYLHDHRRLVPEGVLSVVTDRVLTELSEAESIKMHELLCGLRLLQTESLPEEVSARLRRHLARHVEKSVERDPARWGGYCLRPVRVADRPDAPFLAGLAESVAANLDHEIAEQGDDGSWAPSWSWGGSYPADWAAARVEWSGILTLEKLLLLDRFGRIKRRSRSTPGDG